MKVNGKHPPTLKVPQVFPVERLKVLSKLSMVAPVLKVRGRVTFDVMSVEHNKMCLTPVKAFFRKKSQLFSICFEFGHCIQPIWDCLGFHLAS